MSFPFVLPMISDGTGSCSQLTGDDPENVRCEIKLLQNPDLLTSANRAAVSCGMNALLAPTGGIMRSRLEEWGEEESFASLHGQIIRLVASEANGCVIGGAVQENLRLHEEYGKTVFESAYFDHLEKITILKDAGADYILLDSFDKLWNLRAGVLAARQVEIPVMAVLQVDEEGKTEGDTDYIAALITLQALGISAFGIQCSAGTDHTARLIKKAFPHAEIPLIAAGCFSGCTKQELVQLAENGASIYFDRSPHPDPTSIQLLRQVGTRYDASTEKDSYAAASDREAFFLPENIEPSEPLQCGYDMSDELIDLDDSSCNAIYIPLESTDDAASIAENAPMSYLPFLICANDPTTLEAALRYYQGRLIVDSRCSIDPELLVSLTGKYGAILY